MGGNGQALKPIVSQNPITFINMSGRPKRPQPSVASIKVDKTPSKLFVESYFAKNNVTLLHKRKETSTTAPPAKIVNFGLETSTIGLRKPAWEDDDQPNRGIGQVQELQIPVPVNIVSEVVHTDLTPEVVPVLMEKIGQESEERPDYSPIYGPDSYESYESVPNNELVDTLKMQLKHSPLTHAIDKGQWVYESSQSPKVKKKPNKGQILEWIKNLANDIQPTRKIPVTVDTTTTAISTTPTTTPSTTTFTTTTRATSTAALPVLRRVTARTTSTTTTLRTTTTTTTVAPSTVSQKKSLGEFLATALAQSAAPLAGLSAATIAYGAAAMLPVWLPLALGKKRRKRRRRRQAHTMHAFSNLNSLHKLTHK